MSVVVIEAPDPVNPEVFEWDSAAVGSSPISVVNATLESLQGKRVIVLEARDVVGGAWAGDTVCGMSGIDIGCHDLCLREENAQFLEKFFGVGCVKIGPDDYLPEGGCAKMSERLIQIAKSIGVVFKTGCKVEKATLVDRGVVLDCADAVGGQSLQVTAKKVIRPTNAAFDVYREADKISALIQIVRKQHLYFIVNDAAASTGYFLKGITNSSIRRISNLTSFVMLDSSDQRMFVVELKKEVPADQSLTKCEQIVQLLIKDNFLSPSAQIIKCDSRIFTYSAVVVHTTNDDSDKFEKLPTDFIENLKYYTGSFADLGNMGLLRLQKSFPDAAPQGLEELAAVS